jgi:hypothetical protein
VKLLAQNVTWSKLMIGQSNPIIVVPCMEILNWIIGLFQQRKFCNEVPHQFCNRWN